MGINIRFIMSLIGVIIMSIGFWYYITEIFLFGIVWVSLSALIFK